MSLFKDEAIALRRIDYSESSQVLSVLCRDHGAQRLIAKGVKRGTKTRVAVGVDLLEWGHVVYSRRPDSTSELSTMTEWRQIDSFSHLRRELPMLYAAQYAAEVTAQLTETDDPHPALFDALRGLYQSMPRERALLHLVGFLQVLLVEAGLSPRFDACVGCGTAPRAGDPLHFTSRGGGLLCRDCEPGQIEKRRMDPRGIHLLANSETSPSPVEAPRARDDDAFAAFDVLDYHLGELMGKRARLSEPVRATWKLARPT